MALRRRLARWPNSAGEPLRTKLVPSVGKGSPLRAYIQAAKGRWVVILTGSLLAVYFLVSSLVEFPPPWWLSLVALFGCLSVAQYQVWRQTARERDLLRAQLLDINERKMSRFMLGAYLDQGRVLLAQVALAGWKEAAGGELFTMDGDRVVKVRLLRPLVAASDQPPAPLELRRALAPIDRVIADYADNARLGATA